jgi:uncharacterized protein YbjT (DUF2867 family)
MTGANLRAVIASPVLVVGASGFVGRHICVALQTAGVVARKATSQRKILETRPNHESWVYLNLDDQSTFAAALDGCRAVIYLYHGLLSGKGYQQREANAARWFRDAALKAGIERLVYLGGVIPEEQRSRHLESRRSTGEILRDSKVPSLELRAAMIIGHGSVSFKLVRDIAVRMPVVALPPWLDNRSSPIAIDDVIYALMRGLSMPNAQSAWFELPGPESISHRELISRVATLLGTHVLKRRYSMLSPTITARLLALIGREPHSLVAELIAGLPADLTPHGPSFWELLGERPHRSITEAVLNAVADEASARKPSAATEERLALRVARLRGATA